MAAGTNPENKNPYAHAPYLPHSGILGRCIDFIMYAIKTAVWGFQRVQKAACSVPPLKPPVAAHCITIFLHGQVYF